MTENEISNFVIGAAIEVHRELGGPGLLENIYEEALCRELCGREIPYVRQKRIPVVYKGTETGKYLVLDLLVETNLLLRSRQPKSITRYLSLSC